jgi:hypothetical protein
MITVWKKLTGIILLIILGCFQVFTQQPSGKSDRDKERLIGPVAKIKIESTYLRRENGKWVESERRLWEESEYDGAGKLVKTNKNPVYGDPKMCDEKYKYDEKGRETEKFCMDGSKEKILEKYSYEEDSHGNWTKRVASIPDGAAFRAQWILYREIIYFK